MSIFQRIGQAVKSFIGKRVTGSTTKSRISRALRGYAKIESARKTSLSQVVGQDNSREYRNKLSLNIDKQLKSISNFLSKGKVKHLRTLKEKEIKLFENIYNVNIEDSPVVENLKTFDEISNFKNMLLTTLKDKGVDIYDPRELYEALDGHTPEEIYEAWEDAEYENEDFYEEWVEDPEDVLDKIFKVGVDKTIKGNKRRQAKMWEDMKDFF